MSGEVQAGEFLYAECAVEFSGIDGVVLDGVAGAEHLGVFEAGDGANDLGLDFHGQRGGHSVDVDLVRVEAFGFEEELVLRFVGELDYLVFDGWAVARADGFDLAGVHWRAMDVFADDAKGFGRGVGDVAGGLSLRNFFSPKAEGGGIGVAGLFFEAGPVDGAAVEAGRGSGFQAAVAEAELFEGFAEEDGRRFAAASGGVAFFAAVDEAVEEGSGGDDGGMGVDLAAVAELDAHDAGGLAVGDRASRRGLPGWLRNRGSLSALASAG